MSEQQQRTVVVYPQGDSRPILMRPYLTDEMANDQRDILDMVRERIKERGIEPKDIRKAGVTGWSPEKHWRLKEGCYSFSMAAAYQLAIAVGLKRTKTLPFSP